MPSKSALTTAPPRPLARSWRWPPGTTPPAGAPHGPQDAATAVGAGEEAPDTRSGAQTGADCLTPAQIADRLDEFIADAAAHGASEGWLRGARCITGRLRLADPTALRSARPLAGVDEQQQDRRPGEADEGGPETSQAIEEENEHNAHFLGSGAAPHPDKAEAAVERVRRIPRLPHHSQQNGVQGRSYTRGWQAVISAIDAAIAGHYVDPATTDYPPLGSVTPQ